MVWVVVFGAVIAAAAAWWRWMSTLPLQLGAVVVRGEVWGHPVLRVRARLGRGRPVGSVSARAAWRLPDGTERPLVLDDPPGPRIGAWTITVRADGLDGDGQLVVELAARERHHTWQIAAAWPASAIHEGRFAPIVEGKPGKWRLSSRWDQLQATLPDVAR